MKKLLPAIIIFLMSIRIFAQAPSYAWARSGTGSGSDYGQGTCTDTQGNVFLVGAFSSTTLVCGSTTLTNNGNLDVFLTKI